MIRMKLYIQAIPRQHRLAPFAKDLTSRYVEYANSFLLRQNPAAV